jgi:hypothetical protein
MPAFQTEAPALQIVLVTGLSDLLHPKAAS